MQEWHVVVMLDSPCPLFSLDEHCQPLEQALGVTPPVQLLHMKRNKPVQPCLSSSILSKRQRDTELCVFQG